MSVFNDEAYTFAEVNEPMEYGRSGLPLEDLKALKKNIDDACDFLMIEGKVRINGTYFVELIDHYKRISEIYDNMIAVATYNQMLPAEQKRKRLLASGQQVLIFDKPGQKTAEVDQGWEKQFDPIVLPDDPFKYNMVPTSRFVLNMPCGQNEKP